MIDRIIKVFLFYNNLGGWQIEQEWEKEQKDKLQKLRSKIEGKEVKDKYDNTDGERDFPQSCGICNKIWTNESDPVVTNCNHYFCQKCAIEEYHKSPGCAICSKITQGIFNAAIKVVTDCK